MANPDAQPTTPLASPSQMPHDPSAEFWLPGLGESLRYVGWRWVLLTPLIAMIGLVVAAFIWDLEILKFFWFLGPKGVILVIAIPAVLFGGSVRKAVQNRRDPFCIHCGYGLTGLPDTHVCPECGRPFTFALIDEYRRDPHWFIRRYKTRHQMPAPDAPFAAGAIRRKPSRDGT